MKRCSGECLSKRERCALHSPLSRLRKGHVKGPAVRNASKGREETQSLAVRHNHDAMVRAVFCAVLRGKALTHSEKVAGIVCLAVCGQELEVWIFCLEGALAIKGHGFDSDHFCRCCTPTKAEHNLEKCVSWKTENSFR